MLTARVLGQFEIVLDGEPLRLPTRAAESLCAWLLLHPGPAHRRELLAGILWPDTDETNARSNLRHALWRLRQAIPDGYLHTTQRTIGWRNDAPFTLDAARLLNDAVGDDLDALTASVSAYRGELLPGFYDEWVIRERERLAARYDERISRLLEYLLAVGHWRESIDWAEKWIAQGHTPEPAYRALMTAQASQGNSAAALAAFQRCVDALDAELGVPPSTETSALADAIALHNSLFTPSTSSGHRIHHSPFLPLPTLSAPRAFPRQQPPSSVARANWQRWPRFWPTLRTD